MLKVANRMIESSVLIVFLAGCGDFSGKYVCEPQSCSELGMECGSWADGCGAEVDCGGCPGDEICRPDGRCDADCQPVTCQDMGYLCGALNDGCGQTLQCGDCPAGMSCAVDGHCIDNALVQDDKVSACGGFESSGGSLFGDPLPYCAAEVLHWRYQAAGQTLKLADARVLLNCCGDHSLSVEFKDGVYLFTETDAPEDGWGRCSCMCVFDFTVEVEGIAAGIIQAKIVRVVTDDPGWSKDVWEGLIDLSDGSGQVVIDDSSVDPWCTEP